LAKLCQEAFTSLAAARVAAETTVVMAQSLMEELVGVVTGQTTSTLKQGRREREVAEVDQTPSPAGAPPGVLVLSLFVTRALQPRRRFLCPLETLR
jgi:hypothetical protein